MKSIILRYKDEHFMYSYSCDEEEEFIGNFIYRRKNEVGLKHHFTYYINEEEGAYNENVRNLNNMTLTLKDQ